MPERIPQSTTKRVPLQAYLASDHVTPATGKTIPVTISKNGAAYGNPSGGATNAVEISAGSYYVDLTTTDAGTLGPLFVKAAEGSIDQIVIIYEVAKATNGGWTAIPDAIPGAANGVFIAGTNAATAVTGSFTTTFAGSLTGDVGGDIVGNVGGTIVGTPPWAASTSDLLAQALGTPRDMGAIADSSLTINDAFWSAVGAGVGRRDMDVNGLTVALATPGTHTQLRSWAIDSATSPTYEH